MKRNWIPVYLRSFLPFGRSRRRRRANKPARDKARHSLPKLEALEERIVPTFYTWTGGGTTNNWSDAGNWSSPGGSSVPGINDIVNFNSTSGANCVVDGATTVAAINVAASYTGTITVSNDLTVTGSGSVISSAGSGSNVLIPLGVALTFTGGTSTLSDASIAGVSGSGAGLVVVLGGAVLDSDSSTLAVPLVVGDSAGDSTGEAEFTDSYAASLGAVNANITVNPNSLLLFAPGSGAGSTSTYTLSGTTDGTTGAALQYIDNFGTVEQFSGADISTVLSNIPIVNEAGGTVAVLQDSLTVTGSSSATDSVSIYQPAASTGAAIVLGQSGASSTAALYVGSGLDAVGGSIVTYGPVEQTIAATSGSSAGITLANTVDIAADLSSADSFGTLYLNADTVDVSAATFDINIDGGGSGNDVVDFGSETTAAITASSTAEATLNLTAYGTIAQRQTWDVFTLDSGASFSDTTDQPSITGSSASNFTFFFDSSDSGAGAIQSKADTTTLSGASAVMLAPGQAVTLSATVTPSGSGTPSGTVTFTDGGTTLGSATLSGGVATLLLSGGLSTGVQTVQASYSGDSNFNSSSATQTLDVAAPADDPLQPTDNSGEVNSPGSVPQSSSASMGPTISDASSGSVRYADGVVSIALTDLSSAGFGFPWAQTRTWTNGPGYAASGVNGAGWVDTFLPQLVMADGATTNTLVVIDNGAQAEYFDLVDGVYQPQFYDQAQLSYNSATDAYTMVDGQGDVIVFNGFSRSRAAAQRGEFASYTDATGQSIAVTSYTSSGNIADVEGTTSSGGNTYTQAFVYNYLPSSDPNAGLLSNVTLQTQVDGGSWTVVQQVQYAYYDGTQAGGNLGDLMTATVENASGATLSESYYRYDTAGEANGYEHALESVVNQAAFAQMTAAFGADLSSLTDAQVAEYASYYFQYDSSFRVSEELVAGSGTYTYSYTTSTNSPGENTWAVKTVVSGPDGGSDTVYTNAYGQVMLDDQHDPTSVDDVTFYAYNSSGQMLLQANPSAVAGYNDSYADLLDYSGGSYADLNASSGLITTYEYYTSTDATASTAGGVAGYEQEEFIQQGQDGTPIPQESWQYYAIATDGQTVAPVATDTVYANSDGTGAATTLYSYTWASGTAQMQSETVSAPVSPGVYDVTTTVFNSQGQPMWVKDPNGVISYDAYDPATGALVTQIQDVNTADTGEFTDLPSGWSTASGYGANLVTQYQVDDQGRTTEETDPNGNVTYTVYLDVQNEVRVYPGWNGTTDTTTGPTQVTIDDQAGGYEETLTMAATPSVTDGAPNGGEAISDVQRLTVDVLNSAGQVVAEDAYFNLAGLAFAPGVIGTAGVNYYQTLYSYDSQGNVIRTQAPDGVITRMLYDSQGNLDSTWLGTNDTPASGEWSPANNTAPANMVQIGVSVYDNGGVGDGLVTQQTDAEGNVTTNTYSFAGLLLNTTTRGPGGNVLSSMTYSSDNRGNVLTQTDGDGNLTVNTYDEQNQLLTQTVYDSDGNVVSTLTNTYDSDGKVVERVDGDGNMTLSSYDGSGNMLTQTVYDARDRLISSQGWSYDGDGNVLTDIDGDGNVTANSYDAAGRLLTQTVTAEDGTVVGAQTNTYNAAGNLASTTDGDGNVTSYTYELLGNILTQTVRDAEGNLISSLTNTWDGDGHMLTQTDGDSNVTAYTYDDQGNLLTQTVHDASSNLISADSLTYDLNGNVLTQTDGDGNVTTNTWDGNQLVAQVVTNSGGATVRQTNWTYDEAGNELTQTDGDGNVTTYTWDGNELVGTVVQDSAGTIIQIDNKTYDLDGNVLTETDGDGNVTTNTWDGDRLTSTVVTDSAGNVISSMSSTYDEAGNELTQTEGDGNVTTLTWQGNQVVGLVVKDRYSNTISSTSWTYDEAGNILTETDGDGNVTTNTWDGNQLMSQVVTDSTGATISSMSYTYDEDGNVLTTTNGIGDVTFKTYDGGQLTSTTTGYGTSAAATTSDTYDLNGNVASVTDPDDHVTTFTYNAFGQVLTATSPLGTTTYTYDMAGNVTSVTDADGREITYSYDGNRLTTETWYNADGSVANVLSYTYDEDGNKLSASNDAGTYTMTYDGNRMVTQTGPTGLTLSYEYDEEGNITSIADSQGGLTTMTYDGNRLASMTYQDSTTQLRVDYTYDLDGNVLTVTRYADAAGTIEVDFTQYLYDGNQVTAIVSYDGSGDVLQMDTYSYNTAGEVTSQTVNYVTTYYAYDATGQLISAGSQVYTYDANGNRTMSGYETGTDNELLSDGTWDYTYDAVGNVISKTNIATGELWTYTYDNDNHMLSATLSTSDGTLEEQETMTYDVFGQMIAQDVYTASTGDTTVTQFAWSGGTVYADLDSSGTVQVRRLYDGVDQVVARMTPDGTVGWYLTDHLGSVQDITDGSGAVIDQIQYDAYGNIVSESDPSEGDRYKWDGYEFDATTGLYLVGARVYNPGSGNWMEVDPLGFAAGQSNLQEYVGNNPTNATDPSGLAVAKAVPDVVGQFVKLDFWTVEKNGGDPTIDLAKAYTNQYSIASITPLMKGSVEVKAQVTVRNPKKNILVHSFSLETYSGIRTASTVNVMPNGILPDSGDQCRQRQTELVEPGDEGTLEVGGQQYVLGNKKTVHIFVLRCLDVGWLLKNPIAALLANYEVSAGP